MMLDDNVELHLAFKNASQCHGHISMSIYINLCNIIGFIDFHDSP